MNTKVQCFDCDWQGYESELEEDTYCPNCNSQDVVDLDADPHVGCFSYPNCALAPTGCCLVMGDDVEEFGWKD